MIAAILCPGPSLAGIDRPAADLTIAVNRAAIAFPAPDVWAALDLPLTLTIAPRVTAGAWLTNRETYASCRRRGCPWPALRRSALRSQDAVLKDPHLLSRRPRLKPVRSTPNRSHPGIVLLCFPLESAMRRERLCAKSGRIKMQSLGIREHARPAKA